MRGSREERGDTADSPASSDRERTEIGAPQQSAACEPITPLLGMFHDGGLDAEQARQVTEHVAGCVVCAVRLSQLAEIDSLVRSTPTPLAPPALRDQLFARIAEARSPASRSQPLATLAALAQRFALGDAALAERPAHPQHFRHHAAATQTSRGLATWVSGIAAVAVVALLAVAFAGQQHARPLAATITRSTSFAPAQGISGCAAKAISANLPQNAMLSDLAMTSADDGWAVGSLRDTATLGTAGSLLLHYHQCHWAPSGASLPNVQLDSIAMASATDGWAVGGSDSGDEKLLLHYTGGHWQRVAVPGLDAQPGVLSQVRMLPTGEGWLIFTHNKNMQGQLTYSLYHYARGGWSAVDAPIASITDIAPVGPDEAWAVGTVTAGGQSYVLAHYQAGQWTTTPVPVGGAYIGELRMLSPRDGWAMGIFPSQSNVLAEATPCLLHYDGTEWRQVQVPVSPRAQQVEMLSDDDGWAFGTSGSTANDTYAFDVTLAEHTEAGRWQTVRWPFTDLGAVGHLTRAATGDYWALGSYMVNVPNANGSGGYGYSKQVLLHFAAGVWSAYGR